MKILHRKGHINDIKNYRPINLVSNIYKLFSKVMINRLESVLDSNQPKKKVGFRTIFSTIDNIHTINQLKENAWNTTYYSAWHLWITRKLLILWKLIRF